MQKTKYSPEEKAAIVEAWLQGTESTGKLKKENGISDGRLRDWILQYKANGIKAFLPQTRNNTYSEEIKIKAVMDYLNGVLVETATKLISAGYIACMIEILFTICQLTNIPISDNLCVGYPTITCVGQLDNCEMRRDKHGISNPGIRRQTGF